MFFSFYIIFVPFLMKHIQKMVKIIHDGKIVLRLNIFSRIDYFFLRLKFKLKIVRWRLIINTKIVNREFFTYLFKKMSD